MNNNDSTSSCAAIIMYSLATIVGVLMDGLAIPVLWRWFIVPVFDLPQLYFWQAAGFGLLVSYLTHHKSNSDKSNLENAILVSFYAVFYPLVVLGMGWIIYLFIH